MKEDNIRLKKQLEETDGERNLAIHERNGLKQQCTAAIRQVTNSSMTNHLIMSLMFPCLKITARIAHNCVFPQLHECCVQLLHYIIAAFLHCTFPQIAE